MESISTLIVNHKPANINIYKRLFLIFDYVYCIHPKYNKFLIPGNVGKIQYGKISIRPCEYGIIYKGYTYEKQELNLLNDLDYARHKGILHVLDLEANGFFSNYWLPLRLSYDFDSSKLDLLNLTYDLLEKDKNADLPEGIIRGFFVEPSGYKMYPKIPDVPKVFNDNENNEFKLEIQALSCIGKINRSLMVCGKFNLIPTFIEKRVHEIFQKKIDLIRCKTEPDLISIFNKKKGISLQNIQSFLFKVSEEAIPDELLERIPFKELIIARNNTFHDLYKTRRKVVESLKFLTEISDANAFDVELNKYVSKHFKPLLKVYASAYTKRLSSLLSKFITGGSVTAFNLFVNNHFAVQQGLDPFQVVVLGGVSAIIGNQISNLADFIYKKRVSNFSNTYSYFLNMRDQCL